jgi:hypothetical protein
MCWLVQGRYWNMMDDIRNKTREAQTVRQNQDESGKEEYTVPIRFLSFVLVEIEGLNVKNGKNPNRNESV